jgi:hypothetical protein
MVRKGSPVRVRQRAWSKVPETGPFSLGGSEGAGALALSGLAPHRDDVIHAVQVPDHRRAGRRTGEEWFYSEGVGPIRFLKVVVAYDDLQGRIITAFARRSMP